VSSVVVLRDLVGYAAQLYHLVQEILPLTLSLLTSYICGAPSKARNLTYIYGRDFLLGILLLEPCISLIPTKRKHHVTRHNTPIHNILSTAPQLSISQKALGTLPEDGNVMPKHVGATIHN
jgi:hypothetical protein